jgi:hypothetical protein
MVDLAGAFGDELSEISRKEALMTPEGMELMMEDPKPKDKAHISKTSPDFSLFRL